jgi:hypothetical protein
MNGVGRHGKEINMNDFWKDYRFFLLLGEPPKKIEQTALTLERAPYIETHPRRGTTRMEKGIVFFADLDTAKAYKAAHHLDEWHLASTPGHVDDLVNASREWWACNVAFLICRKGSGFIRNVTELVPDLGGGIDKWFSTN